MGDSMNGENEKMIPEHGGQIRRIMEEFPDAPQPYVDLSTGISPFPYPFKPDVTRLYSLPQPHEEVALLEAAAQAYGVSDIRHIVAGPGTQILINLLPLVSSAKVVTIWGPTYGGHERAWQYAGRVVHHVETQEACETAMRRGDAVVVVNPNNPDGRLIQQPLLMAWADLCAAAGGVLIVDEAFADFGDEAVASALPHEGLLILRSFGKTYGLPGVRLGFVLGSRPEVAALRGVLGEWAVSVDALAVGCAALKDQAWYAQARKHAWAETERLTGLLAQYGLEVLGKAPLFRCIQHEKAQLLWRMLCEQGVITRRFAYRPEWVRFGLPADVHGWERLERALADWSHM